MVSLKFKLVNFLLKYNIKIGQKLVYLLAKYEADEYAEKNEKFDLRTIPARIKKVLLHDTDIIESRLAECQGCEHFKSSTTRCKKCGCFMRFKTRVATAECPIGKWGKACVI